MKSINSILISTTLLFLSLSSEAASNLNNPSTTDTVHLKTDCTGVTDCAETLAELVPWIWDIRNPTSSSPLLVKIGSGTFTGQFSCNEGGHVSLQGSGVGNTILKNPAMPISVTNCTELKFSHLTVKNETVSLLGIMWIGGGTSIWENVEVDVTGYGWSEGAGGGCQWEPGEHYWFSSKITTRTYQYSKSSTAYYATCDVSWFFGSEITSKGTVNGAVVKPINAIGGEVHVYGSVIRAIAEPGISTAEINAAQARVGGEVHIHGSGIDLISTEGNDLIALKAQAGSMIHANQSSFVMKTGAGGTKTRILEEGDGHVHAAYLWEKSAIAPDIKSTTGSDMVVITNTSDDKPHLLISNSTCPSKWHDTVTNECLP